MDLDPRARDAAFTAALAYDRTDDDTILADLLAHGIPRDAAVAAIAATHILRASAIEIADAIRDGAVARADALDQFRRRAPGFTDEQYYTALATGMMLTR